MVDGKKVAVGNSKLMESLNSFDNELSTKADVRRKDGETVMLWL